MINDMEIIQSMNASFQGMQTILTFMLVIFAIIAVLFIAIMIAVLRKSKRCTKVTSGRIVGFDTRDFSSPSEVSTKRIVFPIVEFYVDGECYRGTESVATTYSGYEKNQEVRIRYNPINPKEIVIIDKPKLKKATNEAMVIRLIVLFVFLSIIGRIIIMSLFSK